MNDFIPPGLEVLKVNVLNLKRYFNEKIGRYKITDPKSPLTDTLSEVQRLGILIKQTQLVTSCSSRRVEQKAIFKQLIDDEVRPLYRQANEEQCKHATKYLLGALLHRYFRLIERYEVHNSIIKKLAHDKKEKRSFFFGVKTVGALVGSVVEAVAVTDPKECKLLCAIRKALQLSEDMPEGFVAEDLSKIDAATIVGSLESFKANMMANDNYKKYPHFNTDEHFKSHLDSIIAIQKNRGLPLLIQYDAIRFLQDLVNKLDSEQQQFEAALNLSINALKKKHADFSILDLEVIEQHFEEDIKVSDLKEKMLDVLYTPKVKDKLHTFNYDNFSSEMKLCSSNMASYIIMGACSIIVGCAAANNDLLYCIHQVLRIEREPEKLTEASKLEGILFLKKWIEDNPAMVLDTQFFGGAEAFQVELSKLDDLARREELVAEHQAPVYGSNLYI